jgi:hypothetical protein
MTAANSSIKKNKAGQLILLPLLPVIFFFLHNINQYGKLVISGDVFLLFLLYSALSFVIYAISRFIFRNSKLQSLAINTIAITYFLFFGILQDYLLSFIAIPLLSNSLFLLAVMILFLTALTVSFKRKKGEFKVVNRYIFWAFIFLISYEIIRVAVLKTPGKKQDTVSNHLTSPVLKDFPAGTPGEPDIYHIIFDGYTNRHTLNSYWDYNNDIYNFLASADFYTVDSAFSNYNFTPLSMASVFNLQYLRDADQLLERNAANYFSGLTAYNNNQLFQFLQKKGYALSVFSHLTETKELTALGNFAPENPVQWLRKQTLERIYLNPWIISKLRKTMGITEELPGPVKKSLRHYADYNQRALRHIMDNCGNKNKSSPVFSFTHFLLPHEPYVFDEKGYVSITVKPPADDMKNYLTQIKYANTLIRQITNCLLSDSTRKKIIIIQGDHGYRSYINAPAAREYEALGAFYFFDKNYTGLKKNISHVNTYRIILNNYFGYQLPLLKDSMVLMK